MVLVDTSVWIRFFSNREPWAEQLSRLLSEDEVCSHELIFGELLIGDRGGRRKFLEAYEKILKVRPVPHREVVELVRYRDLHGRGVGWVDAHLLAASLAGRVKLWSADVALAELAGELGVEFRSVPV